MDAVTVTDSPVSTLNTVAESTSVAVSPIFSGKTVHIFDALSQDAVFPSCVAPVIYSLSSGTPMLTESCSVALAPAFVSVMV